MKFVLFMFGAIILGAYAGVTPKELLKAYYAVNNEIGNGSVQVATTALYVPMSLRSCSDGVCSFLCKFLGYNYGQCLPSGDCGCYN